MKAVILLLSLYFLHVHCRLSFQESVNFHREIFLRNLELDDISAPSSRSSGNSTDTDTDSPFHLSDDVVGQYRPPDHQFYIYWIYQEPYVHFFMAAPSHTAWLGVGFNFGKSMLGADIIVGSLSVNEFDSGLEAVISDRYASPDKHDMPFVDTQQDVTLIQGFYQTQWTILEFSRMIDTHDTAHDHPLDKVKYLLWAVGPPNSPIPDLGFGAFPYHAKRGLVSVHFPSGHAVHLEDLPKEEAHASLMLYAWGFFAVVAVFCSRYMKDALGSWWFAVHTSLAALTFMLTFAAFGVIISYIHSKGSEHFSSVHHITGLVVVLLLFIQMVLGLVAHFMYDPDREHAPIVPDKIHWWLGRVTTITAFLNIFTGFQMFAETGTAPWILLVLWVVLIVAFVALFEIYYRGDVPSRSAVSKEYQLVEMGIQIVQQNDQALLFCFLSLILTGVLMITLSVSLLEK